MAIVVNGLDVRYGAGFEDYSVGEVLDEVFSVHGPGRIYYRQAPAEGEVGWEVEHRVGRSHSLLVAPAGLIRSYWFVGTPCVCVSKGCASACEVVVVGDVRRWLVRVEFVSCDRACWSVTVRSVGLV